MIGRREQEAANEQDYYNNIPDSTSENNLEFYRQKLYDKNKGVPKRVTNFIDGNTDLTIDIWNKKADLNFKNAKVINRNIPLNSLTNPEYNTTINNRRYVADTLYDRGIYNEQSLEENFDKLPKDIQWHLSQNKDYVTTHKKPLAWLWNINEDDDPANEKSKFANNPDIARNIKYIMGYNANRWNADNARQQQQIQSNIQAQTLKDEENKQNGTTSPTSNKMPLQPVSVANTSTSVSNPSSSYDKRSLDKSSVVSPSIPASNNVSGTAYSDAIINNDIRPAVSKFTPTDYIPGGNRAKIQDKKNLLIQNPRIHPETEGTNPIIQEYDYSNVWRDIDINVDKKTNTVHISDDDLSKVENRLKQLTANINNIPLTENTNIPNLFNRENKQTTLHTFDGNIETIGNKLTENNAILDKLQDYRNYYSKQGLPVYNLFYSVFNVDAQTKAISEQLQLYDKLKQIIKFNGSNTIPLDRQSTVKDQAEIYGSGIQGALHTDIADAIANATGPIPFNITKSLSNIASLADPKTVPLVAFDILSNIVNDHSKNIGSEVFKWLTGQQNYHTETVSTILQVLKNKAQNTDNKVQEKYNVLSSLGIGNAKEQAIEQAEIQTKQDKETLDNLSKELNSSPEKWLNFAKTTSNLFGSIYSPIGGFNLGNKAVSNVTQSLSKYETELATHIGDLSSKTEKVLEYSKDFLNNPELLKRVSLIPESGGMSFFGNVMPHYVQQTGGILNSTMGMTVGSFIQQMLEYNPNLTIPELVKNMSSMAGLGMLNGILGQSGVQLAKNYQLVFGNGRLSKSMGNLVVNQTAEQFQAQVSKLYNTAYFISSFPAQEIHSLMQNRGQLFDKDGNIDVQTIQDQILNLMMSTHSIKGHLDFRNKMTELNKQYADLTKQSYDFKEAGGTLIDFDNKIPQEKLVEIEQKYKQKELELKQQITNKFKLDKSLEEIHEQQYQEIKAESLKDLDKKIKEKGIDLPKVVNESEIPINIIKQDVFNSETNKREIKSTAQIDTREGAFTYIERLAKEQNQPLTLKFLDDKYHFTEDMDAKSKAIADYAINANIPIVPMPNDGKYTPAYFQTDSKGRQVIAISNYKQANENFTSKEYYQRIFTHEGTHKPNNDLMNPRSNKYDGKYVNQLVSEVQKFFNNYDEIKDKIPNDQEGIVGPKTTIEQDLRPLLDQYSLTKEGNNYIAINNAASKLAKEFHSYYYDSHVSLRDFIKAELPDTRTAMRKISDYFLNKAYPKRFTPEEIVELQDLLESVPERLMGQKSVSNENRPYDLPDIDAMNSRLKVELGMQRNSDYSGINTNDNNLNDFQKRIDIYNEYAKGLYKKYRIKTPYLDIFNMLDEHSKYNNIPMDDIGFKQLLQDKYDQLDVMLKDRIMTPLQKIDLVNTINETVEDNPHVNEYTQFEDLDISKQPVQYDNHISEIYSTSNAYNVYKNLIGKEAKDVFQNILDKSIEFYEKKYPDTELDYNKIIEKSLISTIKIDNMEEFNPISWSQNAYDKNIIIKELSTEQIERYNIKKIATKNYNFNHWMDLWSEKIDNLGYASPQVKEFIQELKNSSWTDIAHVVHKGINEYGDENGTDTVEYSLPNTKWTEPATLNVLTNNGYYPIFKTTGRNLIKNEYFDKLSHKDKYLLSHKIWWFNFQHWLNSELNGRALDKANLKNVTDPFNLLSVVQNLIYHSNKPIISESYIKQNELKPKDIAKLKEFHDDILVPKLTEYLHDFKGKLDNFKVLPNFFQIPKDAKQMNIHSAVGDNFNQYMSGTKELMKSINDFMVWSLDESGSTRTITINSDTGMSEQKKLAIKYANMFFDATLLKFNDAAAWITLDRELRNVDPSDYEGILSKRKWVMKNNQIALSFIPFDIKWLFESNHPKAQFFSKVFTKEATDSHTMAVNEESHIAEQIPFGKDRIVSGVKTKANFGKQKDFSVRPMVDEFMQAENPEMYNWIQSIGNYVSKVVFSTGLKGDQTYRFEPKQLDANTRILYDGKGIPVKIETKETTIDKEGKAITSWQSNDELFKAKKEEWLHLFLEGTPSEETKQYRYLTGPEAQTFVGTSAKKQKGKAASMGINNTILFNPEVDIWQTPEGQEGFATLNNNINNHAEVAKEKIEGVFKLLNAFKQLGREVPIINEQDLSKSTKVIGFGTVDIPKADLKQYGDIVKEMIRATEVRGNIDELSTADLVDKEINKDLENMLDEQGNIIPSKMPQMLLMKDLIYSPFGLNKKNLLFSVIPNALEDGILTRNKGFGGTVTPCLYGSTEMARAKEFELSELRDRIARGEIDINYDQYEYNLNNLYDLLREQEINPETKTYKAFGQAVSVGADIIRKFRLKIGDRLFYSTVPPDDLHAFCPVIYTGLGPDGLISMNDAYVAKILGKDQDKDNVCCILTDEQGNKLMPGGGKLWEYLTKAGVHRGIFKQDTDVSAKAQNHIIGENTEFGIQNNLKYVDPTATPQSSGFILKAMKSQAAKDMTARNTTSNFMQNFDGKPAQFHISDKEEGTKTYNVEFYLPYEWEKLDDKNINKFAELHNVAVQKGVDTYEIPPFDKDRAIYQSVIKSIDGLSMTDKESQSIYNKIEWQLIKYYKEKGDMPVKQLIGKQSLSDFLPTNWNQNVEREAQGNNSAYSIMTKKLNEIDKDIGFTDDRGIKNSYNLLVNQVFNRLAEHNKDYQSKLMHTDDPIKSLLVKQLFDYEGSNSSLVYMLHKIYNLRIVGTAETRAEQGKGNNGLMMLDSHNYFKQSVPWKEIVFGTYYHNVFNNQPIYKPAQTTPLSDGSILYEKIDRNLYYTHNNIDGNIKYIDANNQKQTQSIKTLFNEDGTLNNKDLKLLYPQVFPWLDSKFHLIKTSFDADSKTKKNDISLDGKIELASNIFANLAKHLYNTYDKSIDMNEIVGLLTFGNYSDKNPAAVVSIGTKTGHNYNLSVDLLHALEAKGLNPMINGYRIKTELMNAAQEVGRTYIAEPIAEQSPYINDDHQLTTEPRLIGDGTIDEMNWRTIPRDVVNEVKSIKEVIFNNDKFRVFQKELHYEYKNYPELKRLSKEGMSNMTDKEYNILFNKILLPKLQDKATQYTTVLAEAMRQTETDIPITKAEQEAKIRQVTDKWVDDFIIEHAPGYEETLAKFHQSRNSENSYMMKNYLEHEKVYHILSIADQFDKIDRVLKSYGQTSNFDEHSAVRNHSPENIINDLSLFKGTYSKEFPLFTINTYINGQKQEQSTTKYAGDLNEEFLPFFFNGTKSRVIAELYEPMKHINNFKDNLLDHAEELINHNVDFSTLNYLTDYDMTILNNPNYFPINITNTAYGSSNKHYGNGITNLNTRDNIDIFKQKIDDAYIHNYRTQHEIDGKFIEPIDGIFPSNQAMAAPEHYDYNVENNIHEFNKKTFLDNAKINHEAAIVLMQTKGMMYETANIYNMAADIYEKQFSGHELTVSAVNGLRKKAQSILNANLYDIMSFAEDSPLSLLDKITLIKDKLDKAKSDIIDYRQNIGSWNTDPQYAHLHELFDPREKMVNGEVQEHQGKILYHANNVANKFLRTYKDTWYLDPQTQVEYHLKDEISNYLNESLKLYEEATGKPAMQYKDQMLNMILEKVSKHLDQTGYEYSLLHKMQVKGFEKSWLELNGEELRDLGDKAIRIVQGVKDRLINELYTQRSANDYFAMNAEAIKGNLEIKEISQQVTIEKLLKAINADYQPNHSAVGLSKNLMYPMFEAGRKMEAVANDIYTSWGKDSMSAQSAVLGLLNQLSGQNNVFTFKHNVDDIKNTILDGNQFPIDYGKNLRLVLADNTGELQVVYGIHLGSTSRQKVTSRFKNMVKGKNYTDEYQMNTAENQAATEANNARKQQILDIKEKIKLVSSEDELGQLRKELKDAYNIPYQKYTSWKQESQETRIPTMLLYDKKSNRFITVAIDNVKSISSGYIPSELADKEYNNLVEHYKGATMPLLDIVSNMTIDDKELLFHNRQGGVTSKYVERTRMTAEQRAIWNKWGERMEDLTREFETSSSTKGLEAAKKISIAATYYQFNYYLKTIKNTLTSLVAGDIVGAGINLVGGIGGSMLRYRSKTVWQNMVGNMNHAMSNAFPLVSLHNEDSQFSWLKSYIEPYLSVGTSLWKGLNSSIPYLSGEKNLLDEQNNIVKHILRPMKERNNQNAMLTNLATETIDNIRYNSMEYRQKSKVTKQVVKAIDRLKEVYNDEMFKLYQDLDPKYIKRETIDNLMNTLREKYGDVGVNDFNKRIVLTVDRKTLNEWENLHLSMGDLYLQGLGQGYMQGEELGQKIVLTNAIENINKIRQKFDSNNNQSLPYFLETELLTNTLYTSIGKYQKTLKQKGIINQNLNMFQPFGSTAARNDLSGFGERQDLAKALHAEFAKDPTLDKANQLTQKTLGFAIGDWYLPSGKQERAAMNIKYATAIAKHPLGKWVSSVLMGALGIFINGLNDEDKKTVSTVVSTIGQDDPMNLLGVSMIRQNLTLTSIGIGLEYLNLAVPLFNESTEAAIVKATDREIDNSFRAFTGYMGMFPIEIVSMFNMALIQSIEDNKLLEQAITNKGYSLLEKAGPYIGVGLGKSSKVMSSVGPKIGEAISNPHFTSPVTHATVLLDKNLNKK